MKVKIYRINKSNPLPTQSNDGDAGWDVYASKSVRFEPGQIKLIPLGIIAEAPKGYHFKLVLRSSTPLKKKGFTQPNAPGIIDSQYSGESDEIKLMLQAPDIDTLKANGGYESDLFIEQGDRIAQLLLEKNYEIDWVEQDKPNFNKSSRGGFGSTGN